MAKFRNKPVEVDAIQFIPQEIDSEGCRCETIQQWAAEFDAGEDWIWAPDRVEIPTLVGVMRANVGDWIIRTVNGQFYPCKPDIFEATYEKV